MKEIKLKVTGMSCGSCKNKVETILKSTKGIKSVAVDLNAGSAVIKYDENIISVDQIKIIIDNLGYKARDHYSFNWIFLIFVVIAFYIVNQTNLFNVLPNVSENMGYGLLFMVGLLTSVHCVAMCGGINLSVVMINKGNKLNAGFLYNVGRLISYTILGALIGALGNVLVINEFGKNVIAAVAGGIMILLGLNMAGFLPRINLNIPFPKGMVNFLKKARSKVDSPLLIGMLNGFMPCGPLQTMQVYALGTASFLVGGLSMFMFALGTIPLMLLLSLAGSLITSKMSYRIKQVSAFLIIVLGLLMFNRGVNLGAIVPTNKVNIPDDAHYAVIKGDYQQVDTRFTYGQYQTIVVQKGIPVVWNIEMKPGDLNSCNNAIIISKLKITAELKIGINTVKFTPKKSGSIGYSCWMNMIRDEIIVVDDLKKVEV